MARVGKGECIGSHGMNFSLLEKEKTLRKDKKVNLERNLEARINT